MERTTDTIAAVATPAGPGAIGILRLSGPEAVSAASAAFRAADGRPLEAHPPRRLIYGDLLDREGAVIDKVLATYTRGPASYTGEDTAELHCHGAPMVLSLGLESLFCPRGPTGRTGGVHPPCLSQRPSGSGAGGGGGRSAGSLQPGGGPPRRRAAVRGPVPADRRHLLRPGRRDGPLPRGAGLPGRGHRPLPGRANWRWSCRRQAAQLRALLATYRRGSQILHGRAVRHRGPPQRGQVLPAQRPAGLRTGHCH